MVKEEDDKFVVLNDGFSGDKDKLVQMDTWLSDGKSEGNALFIDIAKDTSRGSSNYVPIDLDKKELKKYIAFLSYNLEVMENRRT